LLFVIFSFPVFCFVIYVTVDPDPTAICVSAVVDDEEGDPEPKANTNPSGVELLNE